MLRASASGWRRSQPGAGAGAAGAEDGYEGGGSGAEDEEETEASEPSYLFGTFGDDTGTAAFQAPPGELPVPEGFDELTSRARVARYGAPRADGAAGHVSPFALAHAP